MTALPVTYVAVDLGAIKHNVRQVLSRLKAGSRLCAVVKANAYGHGMEAVARACVAAGAEWLGVSTVEEGVALRLAGVAAPVLVFLPPLPEECEATVEYGLTATVTSTAQVMELRRAAERQERTAHVHLYEDLGLGRLGPRESVLDILEAAEPWPHLQVSGLYSHFGPPGSGVHVDSMEWLQSGSTLRVYAAMAAEAIRRVTDRRLMFHFAASAMFLEEPAHHFDMVRIGTLLYGQYPDHVPLAQRTLELRDTFALHSRIVEVHTVERGSKVGYGGEFICARPTRVATVPVGLSQGLGMVPESATGTLRSFAKAVLRRRASRHGRADRLPAAIIGSHRAPIIGRVSMDQCCLDVTDIPEADRGTDVILPIRRSTTDPRLPRVYLDE